MRLQIGVLTSRVTASTSWVVCSSCVSLTDTSNALVLSTVQAVCVTSLKPLVFFSSTLLATNSIKLSCANTFRNKSVFLFWPKFYLFKNIRTFSERKARGIKMHRTWQVDSSVWQAGPGWQRWHDSSEAANGPTMLTYGSSSISPLAWNEAKSMQVSYEPKGVLI